MAALRLLAVAALAAACGSRTPATPIAAVAPGDDITLYRDGALIKQRIELTLPATPTTVSVALATDVIGAQVAVLDRGGLSITGVHAPLRNAMVGDSDEDDGEDATLVKAKPTELRLDVHAPRAGTYAIVLGYTTNELTWDVAYTMTASPARNRGELRGALAIRNDTAIELRVSRARVVDAELAAWRGKTAEHLAADLVGATKSSTAPAAPRELGPMRLGDGETRVDLIHDTERRIRSVLVYDPIGTKLDNPGASPLRDPTLGTVPRATSKVTESFEVARDERGTAGLPAGPVRLLERKSDNSLSVLGEARLFDASTRVSDVDTIAVGTAEDVIGSRERREITIDDENRRLTEEFVITLDNKRDHPVEVLVREHLYRGQNWTLAYHSAPEAAKEGPQQISLRTQVPAKSKAKLLYVVVYTWGQ